MPLEIIGMVGTRDASEIKGPWSMVPRSIGPTDPSSTPTIWSSISHAHEAAGFDRVLIGYGAVGPEGWAVANTVLNSTERLKVMVAQRPGFIQPVVLARMAATLDQLTGGGRIASTSSRAATRPTNAAKATSSLTTLAIGARAR